MLSFNQFVKTNTVLESTETRLKDVATVKTNYPEADYWLIRKGSQQKVGSVTKEFNPEHIGVKINRTDILDPQYHYYMMMNLHHQKFWANHSHGVLKLQNIKTSDVANLKFTSNGMTL